MKFRTTGLALTVSLQTFSSITTMPIDGCAQFVKVFDVNKMGIPNKIKKKGKTITKFPTQPAKSSLIKDPLATFPYFKHLPTEIRFKIWKDSIADEARIVELGLLESKATTDRRGTQPQLASKTLVPALLHVNREARFAGLK